MTLKPQPTNLNIETMKYLPLYYEWMERGRIPESGLCNCFPNDKYLDLLSPTSIHEQKWCWWANGDKYVLNTTIWEYGFNPVRQNIVLFMAAMNNEL
jgi:hypothetical protein